MHELAVTQNILDIVLEHARRAKATKISRIYLVIGELSSFVDESIQFYWDIIAKDTIAEHAQLDFQRVAASFECQECRTVYHLNEETIFCPNCASSRVKILTGEEFYVRAIDVET